MESKEEISSILILNQNCSCLVGKKPHTFFSTSMYVAEESNKLKVWKAMLTRPHNNSQLPPKCYFPNIKGISY